LYKKADLSLLIALPLLLAVAVGGLGMVLPVDLLIVGVSFAPLPAAVADDLRIFGVRLTLQTPVLVAPSGLALLLATHRLIGTAWRSLEGLLTIRATTRRRNHFLRSLFLFSAGRKSVACRDLPRFAGLRGNLFP